MIEGTLQIPMEQQWWQMTVDKLIAIVHLDQMGRKGLEDYQEWMGGMGVMEIMVNREKEDHEDPKEILQQDHEDLQGY